MTFVIELRVSNTKADNTKYKNNDKSYQNPQDTLKQ